MRRSTIILAALAVALAGCTVKKVPMPSGGSKADGTVVMSYEFGAFEKPQINWWEAEKTAKARCAAWGYTGAIRFGAERRECTYMTNSGCMQYMAHVTYQCTGGTP